MESLASLLIIGLMSLSLSNAFDIEISPSKDITAVKYNWVYFRCRVTGPDRASVTVTWTVNGTFVGFPPPPYKMSWSQGGVLMIRPLFVGRTDGLYECVAKDKKGTAIRKGFRLTVKAVENLPSGFPKFTTKPRSKFVTVGDTIVFKCEASGNPKPQIRWYLQRRPLDYQAFPKLKRLANGNLQYTNVTRTDRFGQFDCEAYNIHGNRMAQRFSAYVVRDRPVITIPPKLTKTQEDVTVDPESGVTLSCEAKGKPNPVFSWFENGQLTAGGINGHLYVGNILKSVNYTCQARNGIGIDESTSRIIVRPKPLTPSKPRLVKKNTNSVTVTWSKNIWETNTITGYIVRYRVQGKTVWNEQLVKAPTMQFTYGSLRPYTYVEFQVIAVNDIGRSRVGEIDWFVSGEAPPETPAWNLLGKGVSDHSFNATWNKPLVPNGRIRRYRVYYTVDRTEPLSHWSLAYAGLTWVIIRRLEKHQVYYFKIQVVGRAGIGPMSTETAVVKAQGGVPEQPTGIKAIVHGSRSISVYWKDPRYQGSGLDGYEVQYKSERGLVKMPAEFGSKSFNLTTLSPYTNYSITVLARSFGGLGPPSEPIYAVTLEDKPSGPPQGSRGRPRSSTSIEIYWQPPLRKVQNGKIIGYNIMYTPIRGTTPAVLSVDGSQRSAMLTGLRKFTKYTIWVSARTAKGEGPSSNMFELFTDEDVPEGAPRDIRAQALNHSAISVSWAEPIEKSGRIRGYFVYYLPVTDDRQIIPGKTLPYTFDTGSSRARHAVATKNVEPSTTYLITVAAYTLKGDGARSTGLYIRTPKRLPPAPIIRRAALLNPGSTTLKLAWRPKIPGVLRYKIVYGKSLSKFDNLADEKTVFVDVSERTRIFRGLKFGVWYCFKVSLQTSADFSSEAYAWVKMPDGKPRGAPLNVRATTGSATSIRITWESPDPWKRNGKITKYVVTYRSSTGGEERNKELIVKDADTRLEMIIEGLQVNTGYQFTVSAFTSVGDGPKSLSVTSRTDNQELPVVKSLEYSDVTSNSVLVKWTPPKPSPGFSVTGYRVTLSASRTYKDANFKLRQVTSSIRRLFVPPTTSAFIDSLKPCLHYIVSVRIETSSGTGKKISKQFKTKSEAPPSVEPPRGVQIIDMTKISVRLSLTSEVNGPIDFYQICVMDMGLSSRQRRSNEKGRVYIAAEFKPRDLPDIFVVGNGKNYGGYKNKPLQPGHSYRLFSRAFVKSGDIYTNSTSSLTQPVFISHVKTRQPTPKPAVSAAGSRNDKQKAPATGGESGGGGNGIVIAGVVIGILVIVAIVGVFFYCRRRRRNQSSDEEDCKKPLRGKNGSVMSEKPKDLVELHRMTYPTSGMMSHPPVRVENFGQHLNLLKGDDFEQFIQEFESISPGQKFISEESNQPYNKLKNRYPNLLAYDDTRVILESTGEPGSDYLNGNFIDGYCQKKAYIATQGPMASTVPDFWRACWENNTRTIVMMTKLEERGRSKCEQYWPSSGIGNYGKIRVVKIDQTELANYTRRTFEIAEDEGSQTRIVRQFQYTAWPDPGVPQNAAPLLTFIKRVRKENADDAGPIIVHCSAGVGRTGCFIVIDSMLERIKNENTVDIYGYITMLRSQRNFMVQNDEQYIFVHGAILDAIQSGTTEVAASNLANHFKKLTEFNKGHGDELLEDDFKVIVSSTVPDSANCTSAHLPINKQKNRCQTIVPYESNRVCLQQLRGHDGSDYVNASYVDGYIQRKAYIAAQGPLEEHTEEFWRMIMEHNCSIIVMLTNLEEKGKEMCHRYWPAEKSERYYYYVIEPVSETRHTHFYIREFKVTDARDGEARTIRQFQYINWLKNGVPLATEGIIDFIGQVNKYKSQLNSPGPILCHSNTGAGRTGVFITLSIVLERVQVEDVIDIHRTVKTLRLERPYMVQTVEQYRFCFQVAVDFLRSFDLVV